MSAAKDVHENRHTRSVRGRFSAAARTYDALADVQKDVAACLTGLLESIAAPGRILEMGCGSGQLTARLMQRFPEAEIDAVDLSDRMVEAAQTAFGDRARFHVGDAASFRGAVPYPLIVSSSSLHWVQPLVAGIRNLAQQLTPGGHLAIGVMVKGTLHELRTLRGQVAPGKPPRAELPTKAYVRACLEENGLTISECREQTIRAHYPSARAFLDCIHEQGLTGGNLSHGRVLLNRGEMARLMEQYDLLHANGRGEVVATFELLYVVACRQQAT